MQGDTSRESAVRSSAGRRVAFLGVPTRFGTASPGCESTPALLRRHHLLEHVRATLANSTFTGTIVDVGDVAVPQSAWTPDGFPVRDLANVCRVAKEQGATISGMLQAGVGPLICGGDCTTLLGTALGLQQGHRTFGLVSFDAHGDFNTDRTTTSGNIHGMTVATVSGRGHQELLGMYGAIPAVPERRIALLGVRDLDQQEAIALRDSNVTLFERDVFREVGAREAGLRALRVATGGELGDAGSILLHVDVDVLDPAAAPGVGMPVPDGLSFDELLGVLEPLLASHRVIAAEITEAAPSLDQSGRTLVVLETLVAKLVRGLASYVGG